MGRARPAMAVFTVVALSALVAAVLVFARTSQTTAANNAMAVDAVPGGGVDAARTVTDTNSFTVNILVTGAANAYVAEQYRLQVDPAILAIEGQSNLAAGTLPLCGGVVINLAAGSVQAGCAAFGPVVFVGAVHSVAMHCLRDGTSNLHLVTLAENPAFGTTTASGAGATIPTDLTDAQVTCSSVTAPTHTPTRTPTTTPTLTPTRTPTVTSTPTPVVDCRFDDDYGRDTHLTIIGNAGRFTGPGLNAGNLLVRKFGDVTFVFGRSGRVFVGGRGLCPYGPGRFTALDWSAFRVLMLMDNSGGMNHRRD